MSGGGVGQVVSNVLSAGLVAGWLGLRAYEWYNQSSRQQEQEHGQSLEEDELALLRHQRALRRRLRGGGPVVFTFSSSHGPQIFHGEGMGGMMEAADGVHGINLLNLQLGLVDRDFDESDYEMLLALDRNNTPGQGAPVSEEQLASLPHHSYTGAKQQGSAGGTSSAYHQRLQARYGSSGARSSSSSQAATGPRSSGERSGSGGAEAPTCSICLDKFEECSQVSALPCFHTYHKDCLEPWLRQQGRSSTCPICKTPVFEQAS